MWAHQVLSPDDASPAPAQLVAEAAGTRFTIGDFDVSFSIYRLLNISLTGLRDNKYENIEHKSV